METWNLGFLPIFDANSKVLILGSFPSVKSRQIGFYYGNPRNRFWQTLGKVLKSEVPLSIEGKIKFLLENNIALWDVFEKSSIKGSGDVNINESTAKVGDVLSLVNKLNNLKVIFCNGKKAFETTCKYYPTLIDKVVYLPSTSPANPTFNQEIWINMLSKYLG